MKNYIGFARDHTGSMSRIRHHAARDFNAMLESVKTASVTQNQETKVSIVTIGVGYSPTVGVLTQHQDVKNVLGVSEFEYEARARATPLFASVFKLIDMMKSVPDYNDPDVSFLLMITTDGGENVEPHRGPELARVINELQLTDRWTFVFRVPNDRHQSKKMLMQMGISEGNIYEWDQTAAGIAAASSATSTAFSDYYTMRSSGGKSTKRFYANMEEVTQAEVQKELVDVSAEVQFIPVEASDGGLLIRDFVEGKLGEPMVRGGAFYQLVKLEPRVQANKRIAVRNKQSGQVFTGDAARQMLALPTVGTVRLAPDNLGEWEVFIQSTSVNRKVDAGTKLLYWKNVGKAFKEGRSAK